MKKTNKKRTAGKNIKGKKQEKKMKKDILVIAGVLLAVALISMLFIGKGSDSKKNEGPPALGSNALMTKAEPEKAKSGEKTAVIKTGKGTIKFKFYPDVAPNTVDNFIKLAEKGFYDGLTFHRYEPGFVIQGGDPNGNGTGGPGYNIKAEFSGLKHVAGTVAMARSSDPDSAGSQFYICLGEAPWLDGQYTIFGQVTEGMDVVATIRAGDKMKKVTIE